MVFIAFAARLKLEVSCKNGKRYIQNAILPKLILLSKKRTPKELVKTPAIAFVSFYHGFKIYIFVLS